MGLSFDFRFSRMALNGALAVALVLFTVSHGFSVSAAGIEARHRVALAEQQGALVERVSRAACMVRAGVAAEENSAEIGQVLQSFDAVMAGLRNGDAALKLAKAESNSKVLKALDEVERSWQPFRAAADKVAVSGSVPEGSGELLFEDDKKILGELSKLVAAVESAHAIPADMLLVNAVLIDLAARQEVLTQSVGKNLCLLRIDWRAEEHRAEIVAEMAQIDATQQALLNGVPTMGIKPAPTPAIKLALEEFGVVWSEMRTVVDQAVAGQPVSDEALDAFERKNLSVLKDLEDLVTLYEAL
ncbi:MAG: type IV pili methyl-accepting chemotaxis transducer N-terminal domain-containing protein [Pseudomonadota bacterium]